MVETKNEKDKTFSLKKKTCNKYLFKKLKQFKNREN